MSSAGAAQLRAGLPGSGSPRWSSVCVSLKTAGPGAPRAWLGFEGLLSQPAGLRCSGRCLGRSGSEERRDLARSGAPLTRRPPRGSARGATCAGPGPPEAGAAVVQGAAGRAPVAPRDGPPRRRLAGPARLLPAAATGPRSPRAPPEAPGARPHPGGRGRSCRNPGQLSASPEKVGEASKAAKPVLPPLPARSGLPVPRPSLFAWELRPSAGSSPL